MGVLVEILEKIGPRALQKHIRGSVCHIRLRLGGTEYYLFYLSHDLATLKLCGSIWQVTKKLTQITYASRQFWPSGHQQKK